jgi:hypothetical protein
MLTRVARAVFVVALVVVIVTDGVPIQRDRVFLWLIAGLAVFAAPQWKRWPRLLADWAPLLGVLVLYDLMRGTAYSGIPSAHVHAQIAVDRALSPVGVPTVWLQQQLYHPGQPRWYDYLTWGVYLSHFFVVWLTLAALWSVAREQFRRLRTLVVATTFLSCLVFALYPATPPWLASQLGELGQTHRLVGITWQYVGLKPAQVLWESGSRFVNIVAAVPSLHAAYPFLLLLCFWHRGAVVRAGLATYTLAMGFTLVYSGEHFVADILAGWLMATAVFLAARLAPRAGAALSPWRMHGRAVASPATASVGGAPGELEGVVGPPRP